jgi:hypothetical protein
MAMVAIAEATTSAEELDRPVSYQTPVSLSYVNHAKHDLRVE